MRVRDGLTGLYAGVEDDPVAAVGDALGNGHLVGMRDEIGQQPVTSSRQLGQIGVVLPRDHQNVDGRLRINVAKGDRALVAGHYGRWYLGGRNTTEQTLGHAGDLNVYRAGNAADIYGCPTATPRCTCPSAAAARQLLAFRRSQG